MERFQSKPASTCYARWKRYTWMAQQVLMALDCCEPHQTLVLIEGYSYGSKGRAVISLGEYGMHLRSELLESFRHVLEVPPSTLKQFAADKGNASKTDVIVKMTKRFGVEFKTDDEYDAYALGQLGRALLNVPDMKLTEAQKKAVAHMHEVWKAERAARKS